MTETFKTVKDPEGKKQKVKESHCRFKFPFELNGFKNQFNKETGELEGIVPNPSVKDDPLFDPLTYGASYRRLNVKTQTVINTNLELLRNHPDLNNHIAGILILYALNDDDQAPEGAEELLGQNDDVDESDPTNGDESLGNNIASDDIDKDEHRLKLGLSQDDILASHDFIKKMKELHGEEDTEEEDVNCLEKDQLNFKQRIA